MVVYPLSAASKGRDLSGRKNPRAILGSVRPAPGPDRKQGTSYQFFGRPNSYIQLPNTGSLDTVKFITISLWVYPQGPGPLVNYNPRGQGVQIWMVSPTQVFVRFVRRRGRVLTKPLIYRIYRRSWSYLTATYNRRTREARLYVNGRLVKRKVIGRIRLATNYPVRLGAKIKGTRFFKGRIACLQFYNTALSRRQIAARKKMCFKTRGKTPYLRALEEGDEFKSADPQTYSPSSRESALGLNPAETFVGPTAHYTIFISGHFSFKFSKKVTKNYRVLSWEVSVFLV